MPKSCYYSYISTGLCCVWQENTSLQVYLQRIYRQPAEEFEQVNLQTVQWQAPIRTSLQGRVLVKINSSQKHVIIKWQWQWWKWQCWLPSSAGNSIRPWKDVTIQGRHRKQMKKKRHSKWMWCVCVCICLYILADGYETFSSCFLMGNWFYNKCVFCQTGWDWESWTSD